MEENTGNELNNNSFISKKEYKKYLIKMSVIFVLFFIYIIILFFSKVFSFNGGGWIDVVCFISFFFPFYFFMKICNKRDYLKYSMKFVFSYFIINTLVPSIMASAYFLTKNNYQYIYMYVFMFFAYLFFGLIFSWMMVSWYSIYFMLLQPVLSIAFSFFDEKHFSKETKKNTAFFCILCLLFFIFLPDIYQFYEYDETCDEQVASSYRMLKNYPLFFTIYGMFNNEVNLFCR